ncbi:MAG: hypothetical protein KatS3mg016_0538 [Fimbriimonadales bacterium]|nr:MAG: hypothetical protein KatS3mg016_0538 [Fimbriimonadales bacterium]
MKDRLVAVIQTFIVGCLLWMIGSFATGLAFFPIGICYIIIEESSKMGLSFWEALLKVVPLTVQWLLGLPFALAAAFRWGVLHYWYIGGGLSGIYRVVCREFSVSQTSKLWLALVIWFLQIVAYIVLGTPIDYRDVGIGEHILGYLLPMAGGTFLNYYYARRTAPQ